MAEAHNNLGNILSELGSLNDAIASFREAVRIKPEFAEAGSNLLMSLNYMPEVPADALLAEARLFGERFAKQAQVRRNWANDPTPERKLRVGLVSGDFSQHPVGFFIEGVLAELKATASERLEIYAYSSRNAADDITGRIKALCQAWTSIVGMPDADVAARVQEDRIDILIDLAGHTANNRLPIFAFKPAPVQVTWLGYFATTGVAAIDYLIADPWTLPESDDGLFTEKIWRLPETRFCFTPPDVDVAVSALPAQSNGHITFGCFNNLTKMNDAVVALWARVLKAVDGSRLFLKATQLDEAAVQQSVLDRFAAQGIPKERLQLEGKSPRKDYLAAYHRVDIALDPFPFTGGTTSAEGLWMGVPVLTLTGDRLVSRQGVSLLMNAGLQDWVAADADDYVRRAVAHAGDTEALAALREGLRQRVLASPIFDAHRFAGHLESALREIWRQWASATQQAAR
jgi:protein O-GlcNAc transferase